MKTAIFPGSFNPFTIGHKSIVDRALTFVDRIVVAIGYNEHKSDGCDAEERAETIRRIFAGNPAVEVAVYSGLTVNFARERGINIIVRGIRSAADFDYEQPMADVNRRISGIETVFLPAIPELSSVSSSMVRELANNGFDVAPFLP